MDLTCADIPLVRKVNAFILRNMFKTPDARTLRHRVLPSLVTRR